MNNNKSITQKLAEAVRFHRKKSGLNQQELAQLAGVGKTVVFDLEHGKETIQFDSLLKILHVLNIQLGWSSRLQQMEGENK